MFLLSPLRLVRGRREGGRLPPPPLHGGKEEEEEEITLLASQKKGGGTGPGREKEGHPARQERIEEEERKGIPRN